MLRFTPDSTGRWTRVTLGGTASAVPARTVEDQDRMYVRGQAGGELDQEKTHGRGGRFWQDEGDVRAGRGLDGGEDIGPLEALVAAPRWSPAPQPPAVAEPALLAHSGLVHEPEGDPFAGMGRGGRLQAVVQPFLRNAPGPPGRPRDGRAGSSAATGRAA